MDEWSRLKNVQIEKFRTSRKKKGNENSRATEIYGNLFYKYY